MTETATNRSFDLLERLFTEQGALVTLLFVLLLIAIGCIVWLVRERNKSKVTLDADAARLADQRVQDQKEHCERELASLKDAHNKEVAGINLAHLRDMKILQEDHSHVAALLDRILKVLEGFRQDLQRLYDGNKDTSDRQYMNNTDVVKAITSMAGVIQAFPAMMENIFLRGKDK